MEEVDVSGNTIIGVLARAGHPFIAHAAFREAIRLIPDRHLVYRHRARMLGAHKPNDGATGS